MQILTPGSLNSLWINSSAKIVHKVLILKSVSHWTCGERYHITGTRSLRSRFWALYYRIQLVVSAKHLSIRRHRVSTFSQPPQSLQVRLSHPTSPIMVSHIIVLVIPVEVLLITLSSSFVYWWTSSYLWVPISLASCFNRPLTSCVFVLYLFCSPKFMHHRNDVLSYPTILCFHLPPPQPPSSITSMTLVPMKRGVKDIKQVSGHCVSFQPHVFHSHLTHCHLSFG